MPSLKYLRVRINSVKATQKITSAMKMVAASKLRRAQEQAEAARPYAERMQGMVNSLALASRDIDSAPPLLRGKQSDETHLLVVATSDRGLCGGFNASIVRAVRARVALLESENKVAKLFIIGRKGGDQLRREYGDQFLGTRDGPGSTGPRYSDAASIAQKLIELFENNEFDVCTIIYNEFKTAMTQIVTFQQLIPFKADSSSELDLDGSIYEFEPDEDAILSSLLPQNISIQVFHALLENGASEQGARMMAMDNATRNAGDMIDKLTLTYNRTRQAMITKELIEIVSGAEAL